MGEIFRSFSVSFFLRHIHTESTKRKRWLFIESLYFVLSYFPSLTITLLYLSPYQLSKFSLTTFYHENIHLSLNSFDSWPCHGQANTSHLHTHSYKYSSCIRRYFPHSLRGEVILSQGAALPASSFGAPVHWLLNLSVVTFLFPTPLCPLVRLVAKSTSSKAPGSVAEPEEGGLLHCNHGNTF